MNFYLLIGIVVFCITAIGLLIIKRGKKQSSKKTPYVDALHMVLDGKKAEALELLKKTVKEDSENIMAYIKLGDILRDQGFADRAAKIHRNLLIRGDLTEKQTNSILKHLVLDYQSSGALDKAIEMAERLVQRNKRDVNKQQLLLTLYEKKGEWDKAYFYRRSIGRWLKKQDNDILALYKVQSGLKLAKSGTEREARIRYREAMKLDKKCIPAYLNIGDSYRRTNRNEDAAKIWIDFTQKNPEWSHLAFERLREVLFDLGRYGDIEEIYKHIIRKHPKNPAAHMNLAELYKKQGNTDQAIDICRKVLESRPDTLYSRHLLIQMLMEKGDTNTALQEMLSLLDQQLSSKASYTCSECGFNSENILWHCPQCYQWKTFPNN